MSYNNIVPGWLINNINESNEKAAKMIYDAALSAVVWQNPYDSPSDQDPTDNEKTLAKAVAIDVLSMINHVHKLAGEEKTRFLTWAKLIEQL